MLKTIYRRTCRFMPAASVWIFLLAVIAAAVHGIAAVSVPFADFFNDRVASVFRALFARITNPIPFSLAETMIFLVPALFVVLLIACIRAAKSGWRRAMRYVLGVLSVAALLYVLFVFTFAAGYHASSLDQKLDLADEPVSAEQLERTALILAYRAEETLDEITFLHGGASVMPYTYDQLSEKLMEAYDRVTEEYPFIQKLDSRVKPLSVSPVMTYTHISGVYTMFTGEANLNINYPDYVIAYTAAHELAHQRGIARENEANFVAFLVCMASDDPYIRYSGYLNMYEYVSSALYSASRERYKAVVQTLDIRLRYEMIAYNEFFKPYRKTVVSEVSDAVNNTYLVLQGTEGVESYGMVVDLAVAYFAENN